MRKYKIISNSEIIYDGDNYDQAYDSIIADYKKSDLGFGEYIDAIIIEARVDDLLLLLGDLYNEIEYDILCKINVEENHVWDYSVDDFKNTKIRFIGKGEKSAWIRILLNM